MPKRMGALPVMLSLPIKVVFGGGTMMRTRRGVLLVALAAACTPTAPFGSSTGAASSMPSSRPPSATPAATPSPTSTPRATSEPTVAQYLRPLVPAWHPTDTTVVVIQTTDGGSYSLVAVPGAGGTATSLIANLDSP